jgi:regulator of extracellular matrix RemA (YlzA/DUF370 family)
MANIPPYYVDVSGIFNLQQNLLSKNPRDADGSTISNISSNLNNLYTNFVSSDASVTGVLDHQASMNQILVNEQSRLNQKQQDIDSAYLGKERAVILNDSYRLRYRQIFKIITVIIVTLILFILLMFASQAFPFIPSAIFELLSIIVVSAGVISIYYLTVNLLKRSKVYFNELNIPPPGANGNSLTSGTSSSQDSNNLLSGLNLNMCIGSSCCSDGTTWDSKESICIGSTLAKSAFTTITDSYKLGDFNGKIPVEANSPNEFSDYTLLQ